MGHSRRARFQCERMGRTESTGEVQSGEGCVPQWSMGVGYRVWGLGSGAALQALGGKGCRRGRNQVGEGRGE
jgi:hypothetical protein